MELIILFVIFMIISSVLRNFSRGAARGKSASAPPPVAPHPFPLGDESKAEGDYSFPVDTVEEPFEHEGVRPFREPEVMRSSRRRPLEQVEKRPERREAQRTPRLPKTRQVEKRTAYTISAPQAYHREELLKLVTGNRIPAGIVAAEIIAAPRAKRPHRKGMRI